jgi:hypothetical protein
MKIEDVDLSMIMEFMEHGNPAKAPKHIVDYLELLDKVRGMYLRIDKFSNPETIIKHLMSVDGFSRYKAKQIFEETLEYFYCDNHVSKKAWSNIYAGKLDQLINFGLLTMKDMNDAGKVGKLILDAANIRGVSEPDKEELPKQLFQPPIKIYTSDAASMGLPAANRNRLKELIAKLPELTEKERARLEQEADIDGSFKVFPDEQEDPRKS